MPLKQQIDQDLKAALLSGDSVKVATLRGLKSVILNEEVAQGSRDTGIQDEVIVRLLSKESKKRQESADLYEQGGAHDRAKAELDEKAIIDAYLPEQLSVEELTKVIDEVISTTNASGMQAMGAVIGQVKQKVGATADGALIARVVKERLVA